MSRTIKLKTPANDTFTALEHHRIHGDMDGKTCLLDECVVHYPKNITSEERRKPFPRDEEWEEGITNG